MHDNVSQCMVQGGKVVKLKGRKVANNAWYARKWWDGYVGRVGRY